MYLKNASWLLFDKVIRIFGGLFVGIWIARYFCLVDSLDGTKEFIKKNDEFTAYYVNLADFIFG